MATTVSADYCLCSKPYILCLQMNDFVRGKTRQKDGTVPLAAEILAGGCVSLQTAVTFVVFLCENAFVCWLSEGQMQLLEQILGVLSRSCLSFGSSPGNVHTPCDTAFEHIKNY